MFLKDKELEEEEEEEEERRMMFKMWSVVAKERKSDTQIQFLFLNSPPSGQVSRKRRERKREREKEREVPNTPPLLLFPLFSLSLFVLLGSNLSLSLSLSLFLSFSKSLLFLSQ